jgi:hypothetical protein
VAVAGLNVMQSSNDAVLSDVALANVEALAGEINPDCPNGCLANGNGCWCFVWYPCYLDAEFVWN